MWKDTLALLQRADLSAIEEQLPPGQSSFFRAVEVSVTALAEDPQQRYRELAVLLEDMPAALPVLMGIWGVAEPEARRIARILADRSLVQRDASGAIRLHDLQLDYVRAQWQDKESLELIRGAMRLSAHVIEQAPEQFASQMVGRLEREDMPDAVRAFADEGGKRGAAAVAASLAPGAASARYGAAAHPHRPLLLRHWRGGDAGRAAGRVRF